MVWVQMSNKLRTFGDPHFQTDMSDRFTCQKHIGKQGLGWEWCQEPRCICTALEQQLGHVWPGQQDDGENLKVASWVTMLLLERTTKKSVAPCSCLGGSEAKEKRLLSLEVNSHFSFLQQEKPDTR